MNKPTFGQWFRFCFKNITFFKPMQYEAEDLSAALGTEEKFFEVLICVHGILWGIMVPLLSVLIWLYPAALVRGNMVWGVAWLIVTGLSDLFLARIPGDLICAAVLKRKFR